METIVNDRFITGQYNETTKNNVVNLVESILHQHIGGFPLPDCYAKKYIGYTNESSRRLKEHSRKYWKDFPYSPFETTRNKLPDVMILLYKTTSIDNAKNMEDFLIKKYQSELINVPKASKNGRIGDPPYVVYLILEKYVH